MRITADSRPLALWFSRVENDPDTRWQSVDVHLKFEDKEQERRVACNPRGAQHTLLDIGKAIEAMAGALDVNVGKRMQLIRLVANACADLAERVAARLSTCNEALQAKGNNEARFWVTG